MNEDLDGTEHQGGIQEPVEQSDAEFELTPLGFDNRKDREDRDVLKKYREVVKELTFQDQYEMAGLSFDRIFPPIDRDLQKLIIDINSIILGYSQSRLQDNNIRIETIQSTIREALLKAGDMVSVMFISPS